MSDQPEPCFFAEAEADDAKADNDDAFYENFDYFNAAGIQVDYDYEFPPFSVGGPDLEMELDGDAEAERALAQFTVLAGTRGKRRPDSEGGMRFKCFYCMEQSDRDAFYIPDQTPTGQGKVIDRAFCLPECAMGWVVHEASVGSVELKELLIAAVMHKAGRYVKCPLAPYELLCRDLGGLKLRTEAVVNALDQAPENIALWNGMEQEEEENTDQRRLTGKALLLGDAEEGKELFEQQTDEHD